MSELIRITDDGRPLEDMWSHYGRRHEWAGWTPVVEPGIPPTWSRVDIHCTRCRQTRRVWRGTDPLGLTWGCPRIPLRYRWRMRGQKIPMWPVNSAPPWVGGDGSQP